VRPLRVAWDVSPLSVPPTGIGTYIRETLVAAPRIRPEHRFVALSVGGRNETVRLAEHLDGLPAGIERRHVRLRGAAVWRRLANSAPIPLLERLVGPVDAFVGSEWLYPRQRHGVRVALVHDLIPLRFPEWTTAPTRRMHLRKLEDVRRADVVVANSAATARDVVERLGVPEVRLHVAHPGVDDAFRRAVPTAVGPAGERPYLLAVGTLEPRKNLGALLDAYALVRRTRPELALVLVGGVGWGGDTVAGRIAALGLEADVVRTGYVPQADLPPIMAGASAFCWPTLFEGFGMPVAEALAAGVPVVCSDDPSLDEAAGDAAWRVPAREPEALAAAILAAVGDEAERTRRIALGRAHAAALTWDACAAVFLEAIEALAGTRA
jgi:glycosyltransferase involved in cell wall biosynthesis